MKGCDSCDFVQRISIQEFPIPALFCSESAEEGFRSTAGARDDGRSRKQPIPTFCSSTHVIMKTPPLFLSFPNSQRKSPASPSHHCFSSRLVLASASLLCSSRPAWLSSWLLNPEKYIPYQHCRKSTVALDGRPGSSVVRFRVRGLSTIFACF
jgi:hypothetical protein